MKKITNSKTNSMRKTNKLPMKGKVAKAFRIYCAVVLAVSLMACMSITAFAADDPLTVINNLSDFYFRTYPCNRSHLAWLWCSADWSFFEVPRPISAS